MSNGASRRVLVLRAPGINCDREAAAACELAGAAAERVHVNQLAEGAARLLDYGALIIPGGFSYGDHLGAGRLLAVDLVHRLGEDLVSFIAQGRPVLGICNGFQVLVKSGLLPGAAAAEQAVAAGAAAPRQRASLAGNASGHYECRWIRLVADPASACLFTRGIEQPFDLPVGHGEGRFLADDQTLDELAARNQVVVRYVDAEGRPSESYPDNPNGSLRAIAGICNEAGNVFGLMPHPDRAFLPQHHPQWRRLGKASEGPGMAIFRNLVRAM